MDPHHNYRGTRGNPTNSRADTSNLPENPNGDKPDGSNPEATPQETHPQHSDGFTMITPSGSRWSQLKMLAQKEEEDLQRWKEANRAPSVHLTPARLGGGDVSLAEARGRQHTELRQSKLQKQLKKEELDRRRRQEEEEQLQKMKDKQREKAERLEERRRREEQSRSEQLRQDHLRATDSFLQKFDWTGPAPVASSSATHTSSWHRGQEYRERQREEENSVLQLKKEEQRRKSEALEEKKREKEKEGRRDVQLDHRRVNSAFLDKLEGQGSGTERAAEREGGAGVERPSLAFEDFRPRQYQSPGPQDPRTHLKPDTEPSSSSRAEEDDPDDAWAVMKLQSKFPYCSRAFLEDILIQCNNDYQQAYKLLSETID